MEALVTSDRSAVTVHHDVAQGHGPVRVQGGVYGIGTVTIIANRSRGREHVRNSQRIPVDVIESLEQLRLGNNVSYVLGTIREGCGRDTIRGVVNVVDLHRDGRGRTEPRTIGHGHRELV